MLNISSSTVSWCLDTGQKSISKLLSSHSWVTLTWPITKQLQKEHNVNLEWNLKKPISLFEGKQTQFPNQFFFFWKYDKAFHLIITENTPICHLIQG